MEIIKTISNFLSHASQKRPVNIFLGIAIGISISHIFSRWISRFLNKRQPLDYATQIKNQEIVFDSEFEEIIQPNKMEFQSREKNNSFQSFGSELSQTSERSNLNYKMNMLTPATSPGVDIFKLTSNNNTNSPKDDRLEVAKLGVFAICQVIDHLQSALGNLENLEESQSIGSISRSTLKANSLNRNSSQFLDENISIDSNINENFSIDSNINNLESFSNQFPKNSTLNYSEKFNFRRNLDLYDDESNSCFFDTFNGDIQDLSIFSGESIGFSCKSNQEVLYQLKSLLEKAIIVHETCKRQLTQKIEGFQPMEMDNWQLANLQNPYSNDTESVDDKESFVSAAEYIDLSDLQMQIDACSRDDHLYRAALQELNEGNIQYRQLRTRILNCGSDTEYLSKVFCIRLAFDNICRDEARLDWFLNLSVDCVSSFMQALKYDPLPFQDAVKKLHLFLLEEDNRKMAIEELELRGVVQLNIYDVLFDFVLLDALNLLNDPPTSLLNVIQNRWLTESFKRTALDSAVWTLVMAKKKFLKNQDGFHAHFYSIAGTLASALCWGFLSNDTHANQISTRFRDCWLEFLQTLFSRQTRFTCVEDLSDDVRSAAKICILNKFIRHLS